MPDAEVPIDAGLVRTLLREQHEDLALLPLVETGEGWDNKLFRLGDDFVVRLPRRQVAADLIEHEQHWLPVLAPRLPLPVPAPVRVGRPGGGFPWAWSIAPWFVGETAATLTNGATEVTAVRLGEFLAALHQPAPGDAPLNPFRTSLLSRSEVFVERLQRCERQIEQAPALAVWHAAIAAPEWSGPCVWLHGDLHPGNLVVNDGQLTAVIDFGDLTAGDPAVDLAVAWMLWPETLRSVFRATVDRTARRVDDATWRRARGWALSLGVAYLANSLDNPLMGSTGQRTIAAVLADRDA
jgi:aminoglycoside phosphotransferase (APT) family kinase protein